MANPHDKLLAAAAKQRLGPLGFRRQRRSRIWIADQGWWLKVVEFQPSGWAKGSFLNVAAHWLWSGQDFLSFDYGGRVEPFSQYVSDAQFQSEATRLARAAAHEANQLGQIFHSIEAVATVLLAKEGNILERLKGGWSAYHAGMAAGLSGNTADAAALFQSVRDERVRPAVARMEKLLGDPGKFLQEAEMLMTAHRHALGLAPAG